MIANPFDRASVALMREVSDRLKDVEQRQVRMEQRQVRMETRLCKFVEAAGRADVLHPQLTTD